ncbi:MAG: hypothetical protein JWM16_4004 [Verrucomicrobiales bacterium]|nr:hypothetical protein [Verrucomicrobiales bacterium]
MSGVNGLAQAVEEVLGKADLIGKVLNQDGTPISGATVFVYTAAPREGTSSVCPSCYPDCQKSAVTDSAGDFRIEAADPNLVFKLLVTAKDYRPTFIRKVAAFGKPPKTKLEKINRAELPPRQKLIGKVLDPRGNPVFGALVNFEMFYGDEVNCGGKCEDVEPMAVTDRAGEFVLTARKPFDWMTVQIEARSLARKKFFKIPSGKSHQLQLTEGAVVVGRVLENGRPREGVRMRLVSEELGEKYMGMYEISTDGEGRFRFPNVAPYQYYALSSVGGSEVERGVVATRKVRVARDGSTSNVGELEMQPGIRISGRVLLDDGKVVPLNTAVFLELESAKKAKRTVVDPQGNFTFSNVLAGSVSVVVNIPGYHLSGKNKSLNKLNGDRLSGKVAKELNGLMVLLEPGQLVQMPPEALLKFVNSAPPEETRPQDYPLRGAPSLR